MKTVAHYESEWGGCPGCRVFKMPKIKNKFIEKKTNFFQTEYYSIL